MPCVSSTGEEAEKGNHCKLLVGVPCARLIPLAAEHV